MYFKSNPKIGLKEMVATPLAKLRHIIDLLPLLPSGPGGVHRVQLRSHQRELPLQNKVEILKSCNPSLPFSASFCFD